MNTSMTYEIIKKVIKITYGGYINDQFAWEWAEFICILIYKKKEKKQKVMHHKDFNHLLFKFVTY